MISPLCHLGDTGRKAVSVKFCTCGARDPCCRPCTGTVFRLRWKPSAARPLPPAISVDDIFHVQRPLTGPRTRQVNAARGISYRKQSYHVPELHKGDVIKVHEGKDHIDFAYLETLVKRIRKPLRQHTATTRKVQTGGLVKFKQQRIQLNLPKGTYVVVLREGWDYLFYVGDRVVLALPEFP